MYILTIYLLNVYSYWSYCEQFIQMANVVFNSQFEGSPERANNSGNSRKRRLDMGSCFGKKSGDNELWNDTHVTLVRDLEKRGTLWRYGTKHLKLWTDQIISGNSGGVNEEPVWEKHIDAVSVPPKTKKSQASRVDSPSSTDHLLQMMFLQQQQRSEMMTTALLACLSNNSTKFQVCLGDCVCENNILCNTVTTFRFSSC